MSFIGKTRDVTFFGHVTLKKVIFAILNYFFKTSRSKVNVQSQVQMKVIGQGHVIFFFKFAVFHNNIVIFISNVHQAIWFIVSFELSEGQMVKWI
jgi:hypothetical protein